MRMLIYNHHYFQILYKINSELTFARASLQKAMKSGLDMNLPRKRIGWLEDRMEKLLILQRQRVISVIGASRPLTGSP